ncbi:helix-turn-helix transcriptional regulator [Staphylococcus saprophyticus]|nr:helix-turn-helix transcriptional regulator [Staphylococcus saprophyticus]
MTFGENLKHLRLSYCLTQLQMAARMNISRPYYNKLENDNTSISVTMLIYITKAANIPINELVNDSIEVSGNIYNKKQFK